VKKVIIAAMCLMGCSTTSTISRVNAPKVDANIVGGDKDNVYVKYDSGLVSAIPKNTITDIDHPGDGAIVLGTIVSAYGVLNIAAGASNCDANGAAYCTGVYLPLVGGLVWLAWGLTTHFSEVKENTFMVPVLGPNGGGVVGKF
jgi:hypothetical protein